MAEEFCRGNRLDEDNGMRWHMIILNLPGDPKFDPSQPRVQKWDEILMRIAGDLITFIDDGRVSAATIEQAWQILSQIMSRLQFLGIQVALRKVYEPKQKPGPWAGAVFEAGEEKVVKTVTQEKWEKGRGLVRGLWTQMDTPDWEDLEMSYKELERVRGFLGHLSMTFEVLVPYLKGFHLTLASYLNRRDRLGWKYTDKAWSIYLDHQVGEGCLEEEEAERLRTGNTYTGIPPTTIKPVIQLKDDLYALNEFLSSPSPPKIQERCRKIHIVRYGFGDASGAGFGSMVQTANGLTYRIGVWGSDDDSESSNFKELENVVSTVEAEASGGNLSESVLFFFPDNSTVEAALHKGNSTSKKLFQLVVRFRKLHFVYGAQVVVSHVSGKRMVAQGTDGVSRGNLEEGVGSGMEMLSFIPLHLGALARHAGLEDWLKSWLGDEAEILDETGWFTRGHDLDGGHQDVRGFWRHHTRAGTFVWAPPPAAAEVALEELRKALIKRQVSTHVFVCPRLLTTEWLKQLHKTADLIVSIPAGADITAWPIHMHEPLTLGFVFPLLHCHPWQRKSTPHMFFMERQLSKVLKGEGVVIGDLLREFLAKQRSLSTMPELLVRRVLYLCK